MSDTELAIKGKYKDQVEEEKTTHEVKEYSNRKEITLAYYYIMMLPALFSQKDHLKPGSNA